MKRFSLACLALTALSTLSFCGTPQTDLDTILKSDPRNNGIAVSVHVAQSVLTYDLRTVAGTNSMADVFRVLLQFAQSQKPREYKFVDLSFQGHPRFRILGEYFKLLGDEYGTQNPVYTMRTFPENVLTPDGSRAFGSWTGGWIGVVGKQTEDFNEFHRQWWLNSLVENPLQRISAQPIETVVAPAATAEPRPVQANTGLRDPIAKPAPTATTDPPSRQARAQPASPAGEDPPAPPLTLPDWLSSPIWAWKPPKMVSSTRDVELTYSTLADVATVARNYEDTFTQRRIPFRSGFDGIGTSVRANWDTTSCVIRIIEGESGAGIHDEQGTRVKMNCALSSRDESRAALMPTRVIQESIAKSGSEKPTVDTPLALPPGVDCAALGRLEDSIANFQDAQRKAGIDVKSPPPHAVSRKYGCSAQP